MLPGSTILQYAKDLIQICLSVSMRTEKTSHCVNSSLEIKSSGLIRRYSKAICRSLAKQDISG